MHTAAGGSGGRMYYRRSILFEFDARLVELEDHAVAALFVARLMRGPAEAHGAEKLREADRRRPGPDLIRDELRPGQDIEQRAAEQEGPERRDLVLPELPIRRCQLSADQIPRMEAEPRNDEGVEALDPQILIL